MECPLCGGKPVQSDDVPYLVCPRCSEMLTPAELVKHATWRTRRRYINKNR